MLPNFLNHLLGTKFKVIHGYKGGGAINLAIERGEVEGRTAELLRRVPSPLQERVRPLSQQFPEDPAESKLTLSQRFQNVIGSLNAVNKFNREITVTSEVRTLGDGTAAEVTALYIGIGQGFYVNALATAAGTGSGVSGDWAWEPNDAAAPLIATAIAVFKNEQGAEFVRLPMHIAPRKGSSR